MGRRKSPTTPAITWVLIPMAICVGAGFYFKSALMGLIGVVTAAGCYWIGRQGQIAESRRVTLTVVVIAVTYMIGGGIQGGLAVQKHEAASKAAAELNYRKRIYAQAINSQNLVSKAKADLEKARRIDDKVLFYKNRLKLYEKSYASNMEMLYKMYELDEAQLQEIIEEGKTAGW